MGLLVGGPASGGADLTFSPTEIGRQSPTGHASENVVDATAGATGFPQVESDSEVDIWIETDASETYIRIEGDANGNQINDVNWFDTSDVNQGAPGTDEDIMTLGVRVDSVNIYTYDLEDSDAYAFFTQQWNSFTDDDKTTFFNPTNGLRYGYRLRTVGLDPGDSIARGDCVLQFTCRKAGYTDLTFMYRGECYAEAEDVT